MKITMLMHPKSWFQCNDALVFMPTLMKYAKQKDIDFTTEYMVNKGDVLFALHYPRLINKKILAKNKHNIVIHGSDLPKGRGRSPIHHQVEEGKNDIILTMAEIGNHIDDGDIYYKDTLRLEGHELLQEIRRKTLKKEIELVNDFLFNYLGNRLFRHSQKTMSSPSYYTKRTTQNQQLDVDKTIKEQFNKMRVADNNKYPLWFRYKGCKYTLMIEKGHQEDNIQEKIFGREINPKPPIGSVE